LKIHFWCCAVTTLITRRNFAVWLATWAGSVAAVSAPTVARSWPAENDSHVAYRRFRGEDEVRDDSHGSGSSGGGSSSGGGGSGSSGGSDANKTDDKEKPAGSGGKKPAPASSDDDDRFGTNK
jgi:uncharacterized membrane protein YgcG